MAEMLELEVVSASETVEKVAIRHIYFPSPAGQVGILPDHCHFMSLIAFGEVWFTDMSQNRHAFYVDDGAVHVANNAITLIAEKFEKIENLNKAELENERLSIANSIAAMTRGERPNSELENTLLLQQKNAIKLAMAARDTTRT